MPWDPASMVMVYYREGVQITVSHGQRCTGRVVQTKASTKHGVLPVEPGPCYSAGVTESCNQGHALRPPESEIPQARHGGRVTSLLTWFLSGCRPPSTA